jgi:hypothetical protein
MGGEVASSVTKASLVMVEVGATKSADSLTTNEPNAVGVSGTKIAGAGEDVGAVPPSGVGVAYCPHKDAFPRHEPPAKDTAIRRPRIRFTIRPFRELYLY